MTVTVNSTPQGATNPTFPFLGISERGVVVLFTDHQHGTVLEVGDSGYVLGATSDKFAMRKFTPFRGELTIRTDY